MMSEKVDLIIHTASQLLTLAGGPQRGANLGQLSLIEGGALAVHGDEIVAVGPSESILDSYTADRLIDAAGKVVMPGFVDAHTHLIWAGDRAHEYEMRVAGATYMQILEAGGGILSTVEKTRQASLSELMQSARERARNMLRHGTTTVEAKTGYGLELDAELRMLQVILDLDAEQYLEMVPTFLAAHAVPIEFEGNSEAYAELVAGTMLPALQAWCEGRGQTLPFVDVFCETGAFSVDESRMILTAAAALGFPLKIHSDEFEALGGTALAIELGAVSADHLVQTPLHEINMLGASDTVAVALPCTPFGLAEGKYTPAKEIIEAGGVLALASDLNPGTAWCESMQFVVALGSRYLNLSPAQAIAATTINGAAALNKADHVGSLEKGKQADVIILDVADYRHIAYRFGTNLVATVVKKGEIVQ
jgi:imidazolonepropionase